MKLTLEHLSCYLPYDLKWSLQELKQFTMTGITQETLYTKEGVVLRWTKHPNLPQALFPILRPLSDYNDTNSQSMNDLNCDIGTQIELMEFANKTIGLDWVNYSTAKICFENHIDIFGLIENNLAANYNDV